jgi:hypothetical protein
VVPWWPDLPVPPLSVAARGAGLFGVAGAASSLRPRFSFGCSVDVAAARARLLWLARRVRQKGKKSAVIARVSFSCL